MKKIILSTIVIVAFVTYSAYQRTKGISEMPVVTPTSTTQNAPTDSSGQQVGFKDGTYVGNAADAVYGNIQVQATISGGRLADVKFLQYPNDRDESIEINRHSNPVLAQEAIQAQSAKVDIVSGATDSSQAFIESLQSALDKAKK